MYDIILEPQCQNQLNAILYNVKSVAISTQADWYFKRPKRLLSALKRLFILFQS